MAQYDIDALLDLASATVERATSRGADVAEVVVSQSAHLSAKVRLGEPELVEEAGNKSLGIRVMRGQRVALTYTSELTPTGLDRCVEDALELAQLSEPDPFAGAPEASLLSVSEQHPDLDLFDEGIEAIDAKRAIELATEAERVALAVDPRLKNSEGASVSRQAGASVLVTSGGFRGGTTGTYASLSVSPVAEDTDGKRRTGSHWSAKRHLADLAGAQEVGEEAARRTLAKLGARKLPTQEVAVIFDPDAARSILGLLGGCVTGGAVWRKSSYLADREGTAVASKLVSVVDDPLIVRGPGSRPFDGEGLLSRRNVVVDAGVLKMFLLDSYSGRKLDRPSTGNASRGSSAGVGASTTNLILQPGAMTAEALLAETDRALYVTGMMGFGFNAVTGDFSRGASGFWIEKGERIHPVDEVTISLNLDELLKGIDAVADDLDLRTSVAAPTFRVRSMTLAGS